MLYSISVKSSELDATQFSQTGRCVVSILKDMSIQHPFQNNTFLIEDCLNISVLKL